MSTRVRKEFLSPYTAVHNWVSALPGGTSPALLLPSFSEALLLSQELHPREQWLNLVWQSWCLPSPLC